MVLKQHQFVNGNEKKWVVYNLPSYMFTENKNMFTEITQTY